MKHLNPRQGITIKAICLSCFIGVSVVCETPKSPPGDYNLRANGRRGRHITPVAACETPKSPPGDYNLFLRKTSARVRGLRRGVKHLNPRQGITMLVLLEHMLSSISTGVKHLNPRQGITIHSDHRREARAGRVCETPKSPPGDYNSVYDHYRHNYDNDIV